MGWYNWEPGTWVYLREPLLGGGVLRFGRIAPLDMQPGSSWVAVIFLYQNSHLQLLTGPAEDLARYCPTDADLADWCIAELEGR